MHPTLILAACLLLTATPLAAQDRLKATLDKLDASSVRFTSAEARVERTAFNAAVKMSDAPENGSFYVKREKTGPLMGLTVEGQHAEIIEYKSGVLRQYTPGTDCYLSVSKPGIDTYLTLGFGGSGKDLASKWNITDLGAEKLGGVETEKLELISKDPAVTRTFKKISLWIDLDRDVTLKQIFYAAATGDYNTAVYSNIKYKEPINMKPYTFKGKPCKQ